LTACTRYNGFMSATTLIPLTEQQQQALDVVAAPPRLVDPRTNAAYVLVPEADYEAVREALEDDRRERAIRRVALRNAAGRLAEAP
jgi:PHD/YefM family antitoxin component YafN of YafNO toxin-antitoxin module